MPNTQSIKRQSVDWIQSAKKQKNESSENEMLGFFSKYFREEINTVEESLMSKQKEINKLSEIITTRNNEIQSYKRENKELQETLALRDQEIIHLNHKLSGWEEENDQMVNEISDLKEELKVKEELRLEAVKVAKEIGGKLRKNDQTLYQQKEELRVLQRKNNFSVQEISRLKSDFDLEDAKRRRREDENLHIIEEINSLVFNKDQEIEEYKSQVSVLETKLEEARLLTKRSEDNEEIIEVSYNFNTPTKYDDEFFDLLEKKGQETINRAEDKSYQKSPPVSYSLVHQDSRSKFNCEKCDKQFSNHFNLKRHVQDVHEIPYLRRSARLKSSIPGESLMKRQLPTSLQPHGTPGPAETKPQAKTFDWVGQVGEEMFNSLTRRPEGIAPGPAEPLRLLSGLKNLTVQRKPAANQTVQPVQVVQPVIQPIHNVQHVQTVQPAVQPILNIQHFQVVQPVQNVPYVQAVQPVVQPIQTVQPVGPVLTGGPGGMIRNSKFLNYLNQTQDSPLPPGPPILCKPIPLEEMRRALERKSVGEVSARERQALRPESGRIVKKKNESFTSPRPCSGKFSITVGQLCRYFSMNEVPVPVTEKSRMRWTELDKFEKFYLPLVATVNPNTDPCQLKTLVRAKWNEIISGNKGNKSHRSFGI